MTSKKKRHHVPAPAPSAAAAPARRRTANRDWVIRAIGALAIIAGGTLALIGVTPDIAGGWGKLVMMVPGMILVAAGFVAIVETTSWARSRRPLR